MSNPRPWARAGALVLVLILLAAGCARGAREAPPQSSQAAGGKADRTGSLIPMKVARSFLTESVATTGNDAPRPGPPSERFSDTAAAVFLVVEFENVIGNHVLRARWYDPDEKLYLDSADIALRPTGEYHRRALVWHAINVAGERAAALPGRWKVVLSLDNAVVATRGFELVPPSGRAGGSR